MKRRDFGLGLIAAAVALKAGRSIEPEPKSELQKEFETYSEVGPRSFGPVYGGTRAPGKSQLVIDSYEDILARIGR